MRLFRSNPPRESAGTRRTLRTANREASGRAIRASLSETSRRAALRWLTLLLALAPAPVSSAGEDTRELAPLQRWQGDYPVAALSRLPLEPSESGVGFIGEARTWAAFWAEFRPSESVPTLDFERELVLYSRNVRYYNRTSIMKVLLHDGVAEILAIETLSSRPIDTHVAIALAAVRREGIRALQTANGSIEVGARPHSGPGPGANQIRAPEP